MFEFDSRFFLFFQVIFITAILWLVFLVSSNDINALKKANIELKKANIELRNECK